MEIKKGIDKHFQKKDSQYNKKQMKDILNNLVDGIIVINNKGNIVYNNDSIWNLIYLNSQKDFIRLKNVKNIIKYLSEKLAATNEKGEPFSNKDSPLLRVLQGESESQTVLQLFNLKKSERRYLFIKSRPVMEDNGKVKLIVSIIEDITRQKQLEDKKDELINVLGHEFKTPLTSIKAFAQILERKFQSSNDIQTQRLLSQINFQIDHFSQLVKQLLDTTQLHTNSMILHKNIFKFNNLIKEVVGEASKNDDCHNYVVNYHADIDIVADRSRIGQVLINLLSNAARYSPKGSKILIKVLVKDNTLIVSVKDFGVGIPLYELDKIFERFYQIPKALHYHDPHLGLGLYVSSEIIRSHGGIIKVKSQENKGSVFYFTLPIQQ